MPAPLTVYIMRHGEVHNPANILYGRMPNFYLSTTGREQAIAAGKASADKPIVAVYASPMERTQETANLIIEQHPSDLSVRVDERLIEVNTPLDGTSHADLEKINFDIYDGNEPPYEQPQDIRQRLMAFLQEKRQQHANQQIIAVTHGDLVVASFMFAKQQPANDIGRTRTQANRIQALGLPEVYPATASISTLSYVTDDPDEIPAYHYHRPY
ncbi:MAG: histidine phosphatase family protein [Phototrophicaceae bacterium]